MTVFSFRAECPHDINRFAETLTAKHIQFTIQARDLPLDFPKGPRWMGDCAAELTTDLTIGEVRQLMNEQHDAHVMIQSLRDLPLDQNSLDRDRTVDF
jgi:hypothetical protein